MSGTISKRRAAGLPTDYKPEEALKTIAVAEAAENYYAKAKDLEKLTEAVTLKLTEQRNFVLWWDGQEKNPGNRGAGRGQVRPSQVDDGLKIETFGLDRDTIHRWRTRLKAEEKFGETIEAALERCRRVCEAEKGSTEQKGASGTGENEWYTPAEYIDRARAVLGGIDLDPASSRAGQAVVKAEQFFTAADDGRTKEWHGRVWLNPPYAQPLIAEFASKMVAERQSGRVTAAIMLTHNYTDTAWFHELANCADAICFTRGRVKFHDAKGALAAPTQGQAFHYFGVDIALFVECFRSVGFVVLPARESSA